MTPGREPFRGNGPPVAQPMATRGGEPRAWPHGGVSGDPHRPAPPGVRTAARLPQAPGSLPRGPILLTLLVLTIAMLGASILASVPLTSAGVHLLNTAIPAAIALGFSGMALWLVTASPALIWTPAVMFFAHLAVFRGLGPLVYVMGTEATRAKVFSGVWGLSPEELLATHVLNLVGAVAVVAGIALVALRVPRATRSAQFGARDVGVPAAAVTLLLTGALVRYGVVIPVTFGVTENHLPGSVLKLRYLLDLGFALLAYLAATRRGTWVLVFWVLFPLHLFTLVLEFKKSAVVIGLMLPVLGAYLANGKLRPLVLRTLAIGCLIVMFHPTVKSARAEMTLLSGDAFGATFSQRVEILQGLAFGGPGSATEVMSAKPEQVGWIRLSYAAQQAIAMGWYDAGAPQDTVSDAWKVFVPRMFWPDKPTFSELGRNFYIAVTGGDGALFGLTVFADGYLNHGWGGVLAIGLLTGVFFGLTSHFALRVVNRRDFALLPAVFFAMDMALREMNSWILTGIVGQIPFFLAYVGLVSLSRFAGRARQAG